MNYDDQDLSPTAKDKFLWAAVYLFAAFTLLFRAVRAWALFSATPVVPWRALLGVVSLVFCLFPLIYGLLVCRVFEDNAKQNQELASNFRAHKTLVATLLCTFYVAMQLFEAPFF